MEHLGAPARRGPQKGYVQAENHFIEAKLDGAPKADLKQA